MADFWGVISYETATELHIDIEQNKNDWEERLKQQF